MELIQGDCLIEMQNIPNKSIDLILTDPPYGTTQCSWDSVISFEPMWERLNKLIKPNGAIVLFGSEPFSSHLRLSNIKNYKYDWIWEKSNPANIGLASRMPLKYHEIISVFYEIQPMYNKQMIERDELGKKRLKNKNNPIRFRGSDIQKKSNIKKNYDINKYDENFKNPSSIIKIKVERGKKHPTQKPVKLMEYLIKTYTNEKEIVLDFTMGSGTTGVACKQLNRDFIGIELDPDYFKIAEKRIKKAVRQDELFTEKELF